MHAGRLGGECSRDELIMSLVVGCHVHEKLIPVFMRLLDFSSRADPNFRPENYIHARFTYCCLLVSKLLSCYWLRILAILMNHILVRLLLSASLKIELKAYPNFFQKSLSHQKESYYFIVLNKICL